MTDPHVSTDLERVEVLPATRDHDLSQETIDRIVRSVPESTRRVYEGDLRRYTGWCATTNRTPIPGTAQTMAEYARHLADADKAVSTIHRALAAIAYGHRIAGHDAPDRRFARQVIRDHAGQLADAGRSTRKAPPVTVNALRAMVEVLDPTTLIGHRDRAVIVTGFALGARRSEIAALDIADVTEHAEGVQVVIRRSKTDKLSEGRRVALPYGSHPATCPVRTLQGWIGTLAEQGHTDGPLFLRADRHGHLGGTTAGRGSADGRITGETVATIVRRTAKRAGLDAGQAFTGHSLRRGFATAAYGAPDADVLRIARHGGWKDGSATLLGYIEEVDRWKRNPLVGIGL
ncbi:integrase [Micromonospora sp. WMMA2032]|uniref:tyrosine-type recombinase/integrase n=1 Tax=Micromonospora sp. WMMA2032 TaxID=2039870 RepID=UPI000C059A33|nr:tyrosine-type recombinase/integrase [Micromonospora sp. WMMA2032]ATO14672.1 integrase [Micromonospora sp. WMMA2032]